MRWLRWSRRSLAMVCSLELGLIAWIQVGAGGDRRTPPPTPTPAATVQGEGISADDSIRQGGQSLRGIRSASIRLNLDEGLRRGRDCSFAASSLRQVCRQLGIDVKEGNLDSPGHCLIELKAVEDHLDGDRVAFCRVSLTIFEAATVRRDPGSAETRRVLARVWQDEVVRKSTPEDFSRHLADLTANLQSKWIVDYVEANQDRPRP